MTGTTFPVSINALYDKGATRSCMNYDTFFSLGLDLDDKPAPMSGLNQELIWEP